MADMIVAGDATDTETTTNGTNDAEKAGATLPGNVLDAGASMGAESSLAKIVKAVERRNGLRPGQGVHAWFITQNNPQKNLAECAGKTPEEIVQWAVDHCVRNKKGELRKSRGVGVCYERGSEEHTDHIHIVLSFTGRNGGKAETVCRLWPTADIEVAKGTVQDLDDYLNKRGRFAGKGETVVQPVYDGEPLMANPRKDERDIDADSLSKRDLRWSALMEAVKSGKTMDDIWSDPTLSMYAKDFAMPLERLLSVHASKRPHKRDVDVLLVTCERTSDRLSFKPEILEWVVRNCLDECGFRWGEWDMTLAAQPHVTADTDTVLLISSVWSDSSIQAAFRVASGAPLQVAQGYGRSCWASWSRVVIVTAAALPQSLRRLVTRGVAIPLGSSASQMVESINDVLSVRDVVYKQAVFPGLEGR